DRQDLPEVNILRRTIGLRLAARAQATADHIDLDELERLTRGLPEIPQALLFQTECWYQFARRARGDATGGWHACANWAGKYLALPGMRLPERRVALLLRAVARLMLALEPDATPAAAVADTPDEAWLKGLRMAAQSVRTPRYRPG